MREVSQETPQNPQNDNELEQATGWMRVTILQDGSFDVVRTGDFEDLSWVIGFLELLKLRYAIELNLGDIE